MTSRIVCEIPQGFSPGLEKRLKLFASDGTAVDCEYKVASIRLTKSKEEKDKAKRLYRRNYAKRPNVQAKIRERLSNPEMKKKLKSYSERPDVKDRKKILAARNRAARNALKYDHPDLYKEIIKKVSGNEVKNGATEVVNFCDPNKTHQ